MTDIHFFHKLFYAKSDKIYQDSIIFKYCSSSVPKRKRVKDNTRSGKTLTINYHIRTKDGNLIRVCRDSFLAILNVSKDRVQNVVKNFQMRKGEPPFERRGGDRVGDKNNEKKMSIANFIESLKCRESHYCRSHSISRDYLPCELNFRKLWEWYNESVEQNLRVKESYFRAFVNKNYNIGFGTPQKDVCSECIRFSETLKKEEDEEKRRALLLQQKVHKAKAKAFFTLLQKNEDQAESFSFDCQKNLALPKLPDQKAYFSQQYNLYNFTIVTGSSTAKLNPQNVTAFLWTDQDLPKNSNLISSALFHFLTHHTFDTETTKVRLFADGCGGQNKNSIVMGMLCAWLNQFAPKTITKIEVIFPIVGHSFMPPDRVFGLIESKIKKTNVILDPKDYESIIEKYSKVLWLGNDWKAHDWKQLTSAHIKPPGSWHFQFSSTKRFILSKKANTVTVQGEVLYKTEQGVSRSVLKRGKTLALMANPSLLTTGRISDPKKAASVNALLKVHYGDNWQNSKEFLFYKKLIYPDGAHRNAGNAEAPTEAAENQEEHRVHEVENENFL